MQITGRHLRAIIREEVLREASKSPVKDPLEKAVDSALRNVYGAPGRDNDEFRKFAYDKMLRDRGGRRLAVFEGPWTGTIEMFDHVASHLIANPRASTVMQADLEARQIDVSGCPGWPSPIIPRDLYRIGSLVEKIPELREVRDQYKALFDEEESSGVLSRGTVFMIIDMILNSAPARNAAYYINGPDMEIVIHDPVDRLPKDLTMARLESMIDKAA